MHLYVMSINSNINVIALRSKPINAGPNEFWLSEITSLSFKQLKRGGIDGQMDG